MMCLAQGLAHGACLLSVSPTREVAWWQWPCVHVCMAALWQGVLGPGSWAHATLPTDPNSRVLPDHDPG